MSDQGDRIRPNLTQSNLSLPCFMSDQDDRIQPDLTQCNISLPCFFMSDQGDRIQLT